MSDSVEDFEQFVNARFDRLQALVAEVVKQRDRLEAENTRLLRTMDRLEAENTRLLHTMDRIVRLIERARKPRVKKGGGG